MFDKKILFEWIKMVDKEIKGLQHQKEILDKAHLMESSELARRYFSDLGLSFNHFTLAQVEKLRDFIQEEMYPLLADKSYSMIKDLSMDKRIDFGTDGIYLFTNGYYFNKRQAISFETSGFIGFCGWASGCNRIPFIRGLIKWCDSNNENDDGAI